MHQMVRSAVNKPGEGKVVLGWVGRRVELSTQGGRGRPLFIKKQSHAGREEGSQAGIRKVSVQGRRTASARGLR